MATFIVLSILCIVVFLAVRSLIRQRKSGGCCGSCAGCGMYGRCCAGPDMKNGRKETL